MGIEADSELIVRSWQDPDCFAVIFDRHFGAIHRFLRLRVGDALAEELASETFARAFRGRHRFQPRDQCALPWLYGIAANLIRMHRRSEERRLRAYGRAAERDAHPSTAEDDDARLDAAGLAPVLGEALAALAPKQREVLLLHAWAGLSPSEIAEALGVPPATVRKRLHRARANLAERLGPSGNECDDDTVLETGTAR